MSIAATKQLENLIQAMKIAQGITEELNAWDQMARMGATNNICTRAEEIVHSEPV